MRHVGRTVGVKRCDILTGSMIEMIGTCQKERSQVWKTWPKENFDCLTTILNLPTENIGDGQ